MKRLIAIAIGLAALPALAQTAPAPVKPDAGYFRPSDLAAPTPPFVVTDPAPAKPAEFGPLAPGPAPAAPDAVEEIRKAEEARIEAQMDRIERQNERAQREAPAPITGAFTGLTDGRDR